jgi:hypothetical protein
VKNRYIRYCNAIVSFWALLGLLASLLIVGGFDWLVAYGGSFYLFTVPYLVQMALCFVASGIAVIWHVRLPSRTILVAVAVLLAAAPLSWHFAISRWPGGDDGPGMAWYIYIGLLAIGGTLVSLYIGGFCLLAKMKRARVAGNDDPLARDMR